MATAAQLHHEAGQGAATQPLQVMGWQAKALALLYEALSQLPAEAVETFSPTAQKVSVHDRQTDLPLSAYRRLASLRDWMASGASQGLTAADIARHAGMSVSYLHRHFPHVAQGQTVAAFLRQARLQRARQALEQDGASVAQAAERAGYASVTHFAKAFRIAYGCAPSQWRVRQ